MLFRTELHIRELIKYSQGGAPVFPGEALLYLKSFPNTVISIVYGSTEAEPISSITARDLADDYQILSGGLPVGKPFHKIDLKIISLVDDTIPNCTNSALNDLVLDDGEIGEIIVSGPHVLDRYYKNDEAFRRNKIIVDGVIWHRTGDSGFIKQNELFPNRKMQTAIKYKDGFLSPF